MNYSAYFAIEKKLNLAGSKTDRAELIHTFTDGKKTSLKDLTEYEYKEFINHLNLLLQHALKTVNDSETRQRRKIIALFCNMGYTQGDKSDMVAINLWCEKYGHLKVKLNGYHGADLAKLVTQAEGVYQTFISNIYKPKKT